MLENRALDRLLFCPNLTHCSLKWWKMRSQGYCWTKRKSSWHRIWRRYNRHLRKQNPLEQHSLSNNGHKPSVERNKVIQSWMASFWKCVEVQSDPYASLTSEAHKTEISLPINSTKITGSNREAFQLLYGTILHTATFEITLNGFNSLTSFQTGKL